MDGKKFFAALTKQLGNVSQKQVASTLGVTQTQLSAMKTNSLSALVVARMIARVNRQVVRGSSLVPAIQKKIKTRSNAETAKVLGVTVAGLSQWRLQAHGITQQQVCNAISSCRLSAKADAHATAYRAIIEMFPISAKKGSANPNVFDDAGENKQKTGLKTELSSSHGIYIFYDARGKAIYVGQAAKQSLWKELNLAFNRKRRAQTISLVRHPVNNVAYSSAHERVRQPTDTLKKLVDLAAYFSAYRVDPGLIDDFEALFIRAFPNDLLNYKMEKLGKKAS